MKNETSPVTLRRPFRVPLARKFCEFGPRATASVTGAARDTVAARHGDGARPDHGHAKRFGLGRGAGRLATRSARRVAVSELPRDGQAASILGRRFDSEVYPVNFAFYDGKVSEESYKGEHALDYERMKEEEA